MVFSGTSSSSRYKLSSVCVVGISRQWPFSGRNILDNGLFQKKQTGGVEDAFFEKSPEFLGFLLYPWKFQTKASTLEILEIRTFIILEILRPKTKNPGNSTLFFLITLGNSILFLINYWKFHLQFLQYPWKVHILNKPPPVWFFSGTAQLQGTIIHSDINTLYLKYYNYIIIRTITVGCTKDA